MSHKTAEGIGHAVELRHRLAMVGHVRPVAVTVVGRLRPLVGRQLHRLSAAAAFDLRVTDGICPDCQES